VPIPQSREIKPRIAIAKAALNNDKNLLTNKLNWSLRKKLVKCYIWNIGADTRALRRVDQKYVEGFEMRWWRRMGKISWTDRVTN